MEFKRNAIYQYEIGFQVACELLQLQTLPVIFQFNSISVGTRVLRTCIQLLISPKRSTKDIVRK